MPALYRAKVLEGETRAYHIHIRNEKGSIPELEFMEEEIIGDVSKKIGSINVVIDLKKTYLGRSSTTGALNGETMTQAKLLGWLYSIYMQEAAERDAKAAEPVVPGV